MQLIHTVKHKISMHSESTNFCHETVNTLWPYKEKQKSKSKFVLREAAPIKDFSSITKNKVGKLNTKIILSAYIMDFFSSKKEREY